MESLWFFEEVMGMEREAQEGQSVFLRGFGDYERYCLKLTESASSGLGHIALRAFDGEALERVVASVERAGRGEGWSDGDVGHGAAYRFTDPDGRRFEVYHETERYRPPEHLAPPMLNQFQRRTGRGVGVRRLEHMNLTSPAVRSCRVFLEESLGYRSFEVIQLDDGREYGAWLSTTVQGHEIIYVLESTAPAGACTTRRSGSIPARRCCVPPTSSRITASSSRRDRRSTRRSTRSICTCTSPAATASR